MQFAVIELVSVLDGCITSIGDMEAGCGIEK